jgi:putative endonuclease
MNEHHYYLYIVTNKAKNQLYIDVTTNLKQRIYEHEIGLIKGFSKKYYTHFLVYYEHFTKVEEALQRESEIKHWRSEKKIELIESKNPGLEFLNEKIKKEL